MIIDTHAHLELQHFDTDREEVIRRARAADVEIIINPGVDLESSQKAVELSQKYQTVYAAVGIQPEEIDQYFDGGQLKTDVRAELEKLTKNKKVVAIGECGLDYRRLKKESPSGEGDSLSREKQKDIFRRQLGTAVLLDLPAIVHNREADEDILTEILRYKETRKLRGVFHCFTGTLDFAQKIIDLGFMVSFTGIVTYPNAADLRKVVREVPLEKIMIETDSPFLAPQGHRGQRNEPSFVTEVVGTVAETKNLTVEEISFATSRNAQNLFRLD